MLSEELVFGSSNRFEVMAVQKNEEDLVILSVHSLALPNNKRLASFQQQRYPASKGIKWHCHNPDCNRKIFTERFEHYFTPYKRTANRLRDKLFNIAIVLGGNAGRRVCHLLNIPTNSSALIRLIHERSVPGPAVAHAIGIDDWAFKKGISYGTAIVDLHQHTVVDLLPDRETQTVENWFKSRPEVAIVTRDRFSRYAAGVTNALPETTQVADRWYLLKNMGDALQKLLERKRQEIVLKQSMAHQSADCSGQEQSVQTNAVQALSAKQVLMQQVKKMHAEGVIIRAIAKTLSVSRITVRKYIYLCELPKKKGHKSTNLYSFNEYLHTRIQGDAKVETLQLFKEIKQMGYNGGRTILYSYLKPYARQRNMNNPIMFPQVSWVASRVKMLLCKKEQTLLPKDKALVNDICEKSGEVNEARMLTDKFRAMMENKKGQLLKQWIDEVLQSSIQELRFCQGIAK